MAGDLQVSRKCKKNLPQYLKKILPLPPPPESGRLLEITQNLPAGIGRVAPPKTKILATPLLEVFVVNGVSDEHALVTREGRGGSVVRVHDCRPRGPGFEP